MNVLIIEDDRLTLHSLQYGIESLGYTAYVAESSEEAINMIIDKKIDILISDVMLARISGLSLVSVLRSVYFFSIPIIMMSTLNNKHLLDAVFKAGADDFIAKPFTMDELSGKLMKYTSKV
jgi:DNA-binding response OmpR family regulator